MKLKIKQQLYMPLSEKQQVIADIDKLLYNFYTYTPKQLKTKQIIMKLLSDYNIETVLTEQWIRWAITKVTAFRHELGFVHYIRLI